MQGKEKVKCREPKPLSLIVCVTQAKLGLNFLVYNQIIASGRLLTSSSCVGSF